MARDLTLLFALQVPTMGIGSADTAVPPSASADVGVGLVVGMAGWAVSLRTLLLGNCIPASLKDVMLLPGKGLKVAGVATAPIRALVVQVLALGDRANQMLVNVTMGSGPDAQRTTEDWDVALLVGRTGRDPASRSRVNPDLPK